MLEHREASLAHGLHMAKPTFIRARAGVNMSVRVCARARACVCVPLRHQGSARHG